MTKKQALKLYCEAMDSFGGDAYQVDDPDAIADEMRRVVDAKSDRAAAKVVDWWGCWDRRLSSTRMARRIRQIHNGSYKP